MAALVACWEWRSHAVELSVCIYVNTVAAPKVYAQPFWQLHCLWCDDWGGCAANNNKDGSGGDDKRKKSSKGLAITIPLLLILLMIAACIGGWFLLQRRRTRKLLQEVRSHTFNL